MIHRTDFSIADELSGLLTEGQLTVSSRARIFKNLARNELSNSAARALLVLLASAGETGDDLLCAWKAIREAEKSTLRFDEPCLDTCGTGGDGSHSLNLSTLSSLVMAAAGVCVLKHGNRAITSRCGSSDLLSAFGYNLSQTPAKILRSARKIRMGYFHAPSVHPVFAQFQSLRRGIKVKTLFNLLGPVLNPVAVPFQILGTADAKLSKRYEKLLPRLGRKRALIFQGPDGMDEITSLGTTRGVFLEGRRSRVWTLNPYSLGMKKGNRNDLKIYSIADAKKKAVQILRNRKKDAARDSIVLSAAAGIVVVNQGMSLKESVRLAAYALDSGAAWNVLQKLVRMSHS